MNKASFIGRLVRDPELKTTTSGKSVCKFSIAVKRNYKDSNGEYQSDFIDCVAWGVIGETIAKYAHKGNLLGVSGRMESRKYEDRDGNNRSVLELIVEDKDLLSPKSDNSASEGGGHKHQEEPPVPEMDDDLPF